MIKETATIVSKADGLTLDILITRPESDIRGVVQICHGMSENKERYLPFMEYLAQNGYAGLIHDHRGHGKSIRKEDDLGYMYGQRGTTIAEDAYIVTQYAKECFPGVKLVLMGHSMGSLIVRTYLKRNDQEPDAVILSGAPSKRIGVGLGKVIAGVLKGIRGDQYRSKVLEAMSTGGNDRRFAKEHLRYGWICSDKAVIQEYEESPLCGFVFTVDGYLTLFDLMQQTYSRKGWNCSNAKIPILFMGGADDPCIGSVRKFKQTIDHMRSAGYQNIRGKLYPGMRHEILNESNKEQVYADICKYLHKQLGES